MVVSYEGTRYHGWQSQKHISPTVQECLESALGRIANHPVEVICAGRTDAGVHAVAQVVHFDTQSERNAQAWVSGTNHHLPDDIAARWVGPVSDEFHARFTAEARTYRYYICNTLIRPAIGFRSMTWVRSPLDAGAMHEAAQFLLGEHDFSSFRDAECQSRTPFRNMQDISVWRDGDVVVTEIRANAFLHHMVRNIMGVLIEVGNGRHPPLWVAEVLVQKDRRAAAVTAPPNGLFFVRAHYPLGHALPLLDLGPQVLRGSSGPDHGSSREQGRR